MKIAEWLIQHGACHIALMGRSGITNDSLQARISKLEQSGVQILVLKGDVSQKEQVRSVLSEIEQMMPTLKGIFHAAGVLDDGILLQQDWERFTRVLAPKVAGTWNLHILTQHLPLELFVLFSSASSLLGMPGQGNYAAANAFLDAFAHYRRKQSLPCISINWGMWTDVGLAKQEQRYNSLKQSGFSGIAPDEGLSALEYLLQCHEVSCAVLPIDWNTYNQQAQNKGVPVLLSQIISERNSLQESITISPGSEFLKTVWAAPAREIPELLATCIANLVKLVMHFSDDFVIDPQRGFFQLGMDSLTAVQLRNHLQRVFDRTLPPTLTFDYPTVSLLVDYFLDVLNLSTSESFEENVSTDPEMDHLEEEIAQLSRAELKSLLDEEFEATEKGL